MLDMEEDNMGTLNNQVWCHLQQPWEEVIQAMVRWPQDTQVLILWWEQHMDMQGWEHRQFQGMALISHQYMVLKLAQLQQEPSVQVMALLLPQQRHPWLQHLDMPTMGKCQQHLKVRWQEDLLELSPVLTPLVHLTILLMVWETINSRSLAMVRPDHLSRLILAAMEITVVLIKQAMEHHIPMGEGQGEESLLEEEGEMCHVDTTPTDVKITPDFELVNSFSVNSKDLT